MQELDYDGALDYLVGLGTRHKAIAEARSFLEDADISGNAKWPLLAVEEDPMADEENPGADLFTFAFHILMKPARQGGTPIRTMLADMKRLGDQLVEQIRTENVVALVGKPSKLSLKGSATDSLATGWRYEVRIQVINKVDRYTNANLFAPL